MAREVREVVIPERTAERGMYVLEGLALILFGVAVMVWPSLTVTGFTVIFGLFAVAVGIVLAISGILRFAEGWGSIGKTVIGLGLVGVGAYALNNPDISASTLVLLVGFTFLIRGILDIAVELVEETDYRSLALFAGILAVAVGIILLRYPIDAGLEYTWLLGVYGVIAGLVILAVGLGAGLISGRTR